MKTIGEKIKDRRLKLGMKQQDLAEACETTIRSVSSYETGKAMPRGLTIRKLCSVLKVSEAYLTNPEIEDERYGLDEAPYVDEVRAKYGRREAMNMEELLNANRQMFAGGDVPQEDKDLFFQAVMAAYLQTKEDAHDRFTPNKFKDQE